jgi:hypothetical protein
MTRRLVTQQIEQSKLSNHMYYNVVQTLARNETGNTDNVISGYRPTAATDTETTTE